MKYLYYVSNMISKEKYIADENDFQRMISSVTLGGALKVLHDTDYGSYFSAESTLEEIMEREKEGNYKMLTKMGLEKKVIDFLFLPVDMLNLRFALKRDFFGIEGRNYSFGKKEEKLKEEYREEIEEAKQKKTPAELDDFLTKIFIEKMKKSAKQDQLLFDFLEKYEKELFSENKKDNLVLIENEFLEEARRKSEGLAPIFAYFMRKWRAEKTVRAIYEAKKMEIPQEKIYKLLKEIRAL